MVPGDKLPCTLLGMAMPSVEQQGGRLWREKETHNEIMINDGRNTSKAESRGREQRQNGDLDLFHHLTPYRKQASKQRIWKKVG